jgi:hypothetical protein
MKITKQQLKQIIKEELNEITAAQAGAMPSPSGTDQAVGIVRQHLGEIFADLVEGGLELTDYLDPDSGHTRVEPDLDRLAAEMWQMIMRELGG